MRHTRSAQFGVASSAHKESRPKFPRAREAGRGRRPSRFPPRYPRDVSSPIPLRWRDLPFDFGRVPVDDLPSSLAPSGCTGPPPTVVVFASKLPPVLRRQSTRLKEGVSEPLLSPGRSPLSTHTESSRCPYDRSDQVLTESESRAIFRRSPLPWSPNPTLEG